MNEHETARITVIREKQFLSGWSEFKVLIDGKQRGSLVGGESVSVDLTPGEHQVAVNHREFTVSVDVPCAASSQHEFSTGLSTGVLSLMSGAVAYEPREKPVYLQECELSS